jgi:hypothetical protein
MGHFTGENSLKTIFLCKGRKTKMAYSHTNTKGDTYFLHQRETTLKNGRTQTIYFFAKEVKAGALDAVPAGYQVSETKNGLPVLKKA